MGCKCLPFLAPFEDPPCPFIPTVHSLPSSGHSAERGIGPEKRDTLAEHSELARLETKRDIENALDPTDVMNPNKVLI